MTGEGLHRLIRSLTKQQKANFSRFVDARKGSKPNYYVLFERMAAAKVYQEDLLRGALFKQSSRFYQNKEILLDKLIQSLAHYQPNQVFARAYMEQAIEFGFPDLAEKRFLLELKQGHERYDWAYLQYLYRLQQDLEDAYRFRVAVPEALPDRLEVRSRIDALDALRDLQDRIRHHLKNNFGEHAFQVATFRKKLAEIDLHGPQAHYLYHKNQCGLALMEFNFSAAIPSQQKVVEALQQSQVPQKNSLLLRELSILVRLANSGRADDIALQATFQLANLSTLNPKEEQLKIHFGVKAALSVAGLQANLDWAGYVLDQIKEYRSSFSQEELPTYLFGAAEVCFLHGKFARTLEVLQEIRACKRSHWEVLNWSVDLLRLLANVELGNQEVTEPLTRSLLRKSQAQDEAYPHFASRFLSRFLSLSPADQISAWEESQAQFRAFEADPKENCLLKLFDLRSWLVSKVSHLSMVDLHRSKNAPADPQHRKAL